MDLYKVSFLIVFLVAAYVDGDFVKYKNGKLYFNSCECGKAVAVGYGFFFTKYQILNIHKRN